MATPNTPLTPGEFRPDGALEHGLLEGNPTPGGKLVPLLLVAAIAARHARTWGSVISWSLRSWKPRSRASTQVRGATSSSA